MPKKGCSVINVQLKLCCFCGKEIINEGITNKTTKKVLCLDCLLDILKNLWEQANEKDNTD